MTGIRRAFCLFLSFSILISAAFCSTAWVLRTYAAQRGYVDATDVNIREDATTKSKSLGKTPLYEKVYVTVNGQKTGVDGYIWYNITYNGITGYIRGDFIKIIEQTEDATFEEQLNAFPESYKPYLRDLHAVYPNWKFYADKINLTLDEAVELEAPRLNATPITYKTVHYTTAKSWLSMGFGAYEYSQNKWVLRDTSYYIASRELVKYYMDPRNFLDGSYIYTFMLQGYDGSAQNADGVRNIVKNTFLDTDEYINIIMDAAQQSGVSPYVIAAKIIQEQGTKGTSPLISGTYAGYEGYYNYFNVAASSDTSGDKVKNGLNYARAHGWNSRSASIIGGAKFYARNYISVGQNTFYYMDYNIKNPSLINHQYATAVYDAANKGKGLAKTYSSDRNGSLSFVIPVYNGMGDTAAAKPAENGNLNNYYFDSIEVYGLSDSFNRFKYNYTLAVSGDTSIKVTVPAGAAYVSASSFALNAGVTDIVLTVRGQSGYTTDYRLSVKADRACTVYINSNGSSPVPTPDPTPSGNARGDTNGDGVVNGRDAANIQLHILGIRNLSGSAFTAADTNGDGVVNGRDAANVQLHILGIRNLT